MTYTTKYTREKVEEAVKYSTSMVGVIRLLGSRSYSGNLHQHLKNRCKEWDIDIAHLGTREGPRGKISSKKKEAGSILIETERDSRVPTYQLRRALVEIGREPKCGCGTGEKWNGIKLVLHIDHIDGNWKNNKPHNLRFLCPNCHSQTDTYYRKAK